MDLSARGVSDAVNEGEVIRHSNLSSLPPNTAQIHYWVTYLNFIQTELTHTMCRAEEIAKACVAPG